MGAGATAAGAVAAARSATDSPDGPPPAVMEEIMKEIFGGKPPSNNVAFMYYLTATSMALLFKDVIYEKANSLMLFQDPTQSRVIYSAYY